MSHAIFGFAAQSSGTRNFLTIDSDISRHFVCNNVAIPIGLLKHTEGCNRYGSAIRWKQFVGRSSIVYRSMFCCNNWSFQYKRIASFQNWLTVGRRGLVSFMRLQSAILCSLLCWFPSAEDDVGDVKLTDDDQLFEIDCRSPGMSLLTICQRKPQASGRKRMKLSANLAFKLSWFTIEPFNWTLPPL